ncbi:MAG: AAA domain-containing protein [Moorellaceae bacterium]
MARVEQELSRCRQEIRAGQSLVIEAAEVVGTTLSKATVDSAVFQHHWDTVIVDEASMASIAHVAYAASLAAKRMVVGDFRELAPIALVQNDPLVDRWLRRDIFKFD